MGINPLRKKPKLEEKKNRIFMGINPRHTSIYFYLFTNNYTKVPVNFLNVFVQAKKIWKKNKIEKNCIFFALNCVNFEYLVAK